MKKSGWDCWQDCCTPVQEVCTWAVSSGQFCKAVGLSSGLDEQRGDGNARGARCAQMCPCRCRPCLLHPRAIHTQPCGWTGRAVCDTGVNACVCLEGCLCAGCFQAAFWMFVSYLVYSREGVVRQMGFAEGPKNGQTFAWSHFPCCISESPSVLALLH